MKMNRNEFLALVTLLVVFIPAAPARAVPIAVPNFSFEAPVRADGNFTATASNNDTTAVTNWIAGLPGSSMSVGVQNPMDAQFAGTTGGPLPAPGDGNQSAYINLYSTTSGQTATLTSQNSLGTIQDNSIYTLTVALGRRLDADDPETVSISLLANGTPIPGAITTILGTTLTPGTYEDYSASFSTSLLGDPLAGQSLTIQLAHSKVAGTPGNMQMNFDNVRLNVEEVPPVPPAPEPSTWLLMVIGIVGLLRRRAQ
jgi:hypothetical protein